MGWWGNRGRTGALGLIMALGPGRGRRDDEERERQAGLRRRFGEGERGECSEVRRIGK